MSRSLRVTSLSFLATTVIAGIALVGVVPAQASSGLTARTPGLHGFRGRQALLRAAAPQIWSAAPACSTATRPGVAHCDALIRTDATARAERPLAGRATAAGAFGDNGAYSPAFLQSAYNVPALNLAAGAGAGRIVAIVDAYDDPNIASDLAYYRSYFGLSPCPSGVVSPGASGCVLQQVNQNGSPSPLPTADASWAIEESIDVEMVSAICPNCQILLVETNSAAINDLGTGVNTAVAMGASVVSNSYGSSEYASENSDATSYFNHPGIPIVAASGDSGFGVEFPAAAPTVVAVGGTSLIQNSATGFRSGSESAWVGAGAGCSAYEPKPAWQHDTACATRSVADVSAVADPGNGVWLYDTYGRAGLAIAGGTSVAAPVVSAIFALAAPSPTVAYAASNLYAHPGALYAVTTGSDGTCGSYLCDASLSQGGYAGPTGLGTPGGSPSSLAAFSPPTALGAPPVLTSAVAADGSVALAWTPPSGNLYPTTGYNVYASSPSGIVPTPINAQPLTGTDYTVTSLTNGTSYGFVVTALNAVGESEPSNVLSATPVRPSTVAGSPIAVIATLANGEVRVHWTAPNDDGGSPISYYLVSDAAGQRCIDQVTLTGVDSCLVGGLAPGATYSFTVSAVNEIGESQPSTPSNAVTIPTRAPAPRAAAPRSRRTSRVAFAARSSVLNIHARTALAVFARHLTNGARVALTGYAPGNPGLARQRVQVVARFLAGRVNLHTSSRTVTTGRLSVVAINATGVFK